MSLFESITGRPTRQGVAHFFRYLGDDEILAGQIVETLCRLPTDVLEFAIERCSFLSVGRTCHGAVYPGSISVHPLMKRSRKVWLIVLDEDLPEERAEDIIAHMIADAWLSHNRKGNLLLDFEIQAASLTRHWGFSGLGADPEHCNAPFENLNV